MFCVEWRNTEMEYQRKDAMSAAMDSEFSIDNGLSHLKSRLILDAAIKSYVNTYKSSLNLGMLWGVDLLEEPKTLQVNIPHRFPK